jgi:hypothetical protein
MKECIECGILIEDDARFCKVCGAFQRPKDMGRDGRRSTRPYQTAPIGSPETAGDKDLNERQRRGLNRLCILGIMISVLGIFMAGFRYWFGIIYGIVAMVFGSMAVHYKVEFGDTCLILGAVCTILSSSLPFALGV